MSTKSINHGIARRACVYYNKQEKKCVKGLKCVSVLRPCFKSLADALRTDEERAANEKTKKEYQSRYLELQEETKQAVGNES